MEFGIWNLESGIVLNQESAPSLADDWRMNNGISESRRKGEVIVLFITWIREADIFVACGNRIRCSALLPWALLHWYFYFGQSKGGNHKGCPVETSAMRPKEVPLGYRSADRAGRQDRGTACAACVEGWNAARGGSENNEYWMVNSE